MAHVKRDTGRVVITKIGTAFCQSCETDADVVTSSMFEGIPFWDNHSMVLNNPQKGTPYEDVVTCWGSLCYPHPNAIQEV